MAAFLTEWLGARKASLHPKTLHQYQQIWNDYLAPRLGRIKLKDLRPDQIQLPYTSSLASETSPRTVLLMHGVLHAALNQALKWGLIGRNPADGVDRPRLKKKEMKVLNGEQVKVLLNAAKPTRYEALLRVAIATGLREGELLGLKWPDPNWRARRLTVQRQLQRIDGQKLAFNQPKTAAGKRTVVLGASTLARLRAHHVVQSYEKPFAGDRWRDHDLMFPSLIGTPLEPRNLYRSFKELLGQTGLPNISFHDLRHAAASLMLNHGVPPLVVSKIPGHANASITLTIRAHSGLQMQTQAAGIINEIATPIPMSVAQLHPSASNRIQMQHAPKSVD